MTVLSSGVAWGAAGGMALAALVMVLTPGPNMIYLVSRSITQGRVAGLVSLVGTGIGFLAYMTMANVGLAVIFVVVPWLYIGLKAAGVIYLAASRGRRSARGGLDCSSRPGLRTTRDGSCSGWAC